MRHYTFVDYATQIYAALVAIMVILFHNGTVHHWQWIVMAHAGILLGVHGLIRWHAHRPLLKFVDFLRHFYPVFLYTWFFCQTGWLNRMFFPGYLDPVIIRWEQALFGGQPSVSFMQHLPYIPLSELFYASYFSYYIMISGVGFALFFRNRQQFFHYVSIVSFLFYVCYLIYIILPVIGPRVFFREIAGYELPADLQQFAPADAYPEAVTAGPFFQIMAFIYRTFEAPGAALPSSHVAVALCTVYFSFKYLRPIRYYHTVIALLLCASTVYCRYHYVIDVFAGALTFALVMPLGNYLYFKFIAGTPNPLTAPLARRPAALAQISSHVAGE